MCPHGFCDKGEHDKCIEREKDMRYSGCTCQHKVLVKVMTTPPKEIRLNRSWYSPIEVAHMLGIKPRTVWGYLKKPSKKYPDRNLLVGEKIDTMWRIYREDLVKFFAEMYGG